MMERRGREGARKRPKGEKRESGMVKRRKEKGYPLSFDCYCQRIQEMQDALSDREDESRSLVPMTPSSAEPVATLGQADHSSCSRNARFLPLPSPSAVGEMTRHAGAQKNESERSLGEWTHGRGTQGPQ
tara:strand:+ start:124 stop:510 length:387 start_codon:yes stop_codon:yes gene_type:complete